MADFKIKGFRYQTGRLDLFQQWDIFKRMGPFATTLGLIYQGWEPNSKVADMLPIIAPPLLQIFSKMSDADSHYVRDTLLSITQRQSPTGAFVAVTSPGGVMFEDISLFVVCAICWYALEENFRPFLLDLIEIVPAKGSTIAV